MPLKKGTSRKTMSKNIKTEMHAYERTGKIGNSKPASKKKAQKQAVAIAYSKARESGAALPKKQSSSPTKKRTTAKKPGPKKGTRKTAAKKSSSRKKAS